MATVSHAVCAYERINKSDYCLLLICLLVEVLFCFLIVSFDDKMEEDENLLPTNLEGEKIGAHQGSAAAGHHMTWKLKKLLWLKLFSKRRAFPVRSEEAG